MKLVKCLTGLALAGALATPALAQDPTFFPHRHRWRWWDLLPHWWHDRERHLGPSGLASV